LVRIARVAGETPKDTLPAWFTWENDLTVWKCILDDLGVDMYAQQSLMALSQQGYQGYWAANELIGKLLKKTNDRVRINNPSAFIFSSVINARHALNER
jgi:hypothetical protein